MRAGPHHLHEARERALGQQRLLVRSCSRAPQRRSTSERSPGPTLAGHAFHAARAADPIPAARLKAALRLLRLDCVPSSMAKLRRTAQARRAIAGDASVTRPSTRSTAPASAASSSRRTSSSATRFPSTRSACKRVASGASRTTAIAVATSGCSLSRPRPSTVLTNTQHVSPRAHTEQTTVPRTILAKVCDDAQDDFEVVPRRCAAELAERPDRERERAAVRKRRTRLGCPSVRAPRASVPAPAPLPQHRSSSSSRARVRGLRDAPVHATSATPRTAAARSVAVVAAHTAAAASTTTAAAAAA